MGDIKRKSFSDYKSRGEYFNEKINKAWLEQALYSAYLKAKRGKEGTEDVRKFSAYWRRNLDILLSEILDGRYKPSRGIAFTVEEPVKREIFAAPFRDRIVHHFLYDEVADWWDRRFIYNSFSCRKGKGTLFGIMRLDKDMRQASRGYREKAYVIKLDIQGYFMSLPREKLYRQIVWGLKKQHPKGGPHYQLLKYLWKEVIFDNPVEGVKFRQPRSAWNGLPENKSLLHQPPGRGIVIGNLSSQLLSNIYLDQLDRFITMQLGYKHYGRYVDDFYIIVPESQYKQVLRDIKVVERYLFSLGLVLHPKKRYVQDIRKGVPFLGVVVYPNRIVLSKRFKKSFFKAAREVAEGRRKIETIVSYLGYCKYFDSHKLCKKVFDSVGWRYRF